MASTFQSRTHHSNLPEPAIAGEKEERKKREMNS
jgi:hypothetical protein